MDPKYTAEVIAEKCRLAPLASAILQARETPLRIRVEQDGTGVIRSITVEPLNCVWGMTVELEHGPDR
jgi:hypothetical protein